MLFIVVIEVDESIKMLYPFHSDRNRLFENEIEILKKLNKKFKKESKDPLKRCC